MKKRILKNMILTVLITALLLSALIMGGLFRYFSDQTVRELERDLSQITVCLNREADQALYLSEMEGYGFPERVTLIAPDGYVLYDSASNPSGMENHLEREEVAEAIADGHGESYRYSATLREKTYYFASRLEDGSIIRMSDTRDSTFGLLTQFAGWYVAGLAAICVVAALVAIRMTRRIVQPINDLDLSEPDENGTYPELKPLLARMAHQSRSIQEYIRELNARRVEFDAITASMEEGLALFDPKGGIVFINRSASHLFGGDEARTATGLSDDPAYLAVIGRALRGKSSEGILEKSGRFYDLIANPVYDAGHFSGIVLLIPDITEKHQSELTRREFTANVSHELKTPLTSIIGYAEIMQNGIAAPEDMQSFSQSIHKEATRLLRLVEDILRLSKLENGTPFGEEERIDLARLSREIAERFFAPAAARSVAITCDAQPACVRGIPLVLDEAAANLVDNAIKYNKEGGRVDIRCMREGDYAVFSVSDTGIGISECDQARVFERFFRVDKSRSKATGGTGLGLSIVKHAVTLCRGTVEMNSVPGQGTTVTLRFPAEEM